MGTVRPGQLADPGDGRSPARRGAAVRSGQLRPRELERPLGDRVPRRRGQRLRAPAGVADRRRGRPRGAGEHRRGAAGDARQPLLRRLAALPVGPTRHRRHRRRLQRLRLPRDLVAVVVRPGRHGARPPRPVRLVPLPRHGHHRRDLLRHRRRPPLHDDGNPQHGRHGRASAGGDGHAHGAGRLRLPQHRPGAQAGPVPHAPVAAGRVRVRPLGGHPVPRGHRDQGRRLRVPALLLHHLRRRLRLRQPQPRLPAHTPGPRRGLRRLPGGPVPGTTSSACSPTPASPRSGT